ncbi:MAG: histidine kinase [Flavobacteriales bacterium]|nr:histidine kinase [Flavobacteriales bacterium]
MLKKATVTLLSFLIISSFVFAGEKKEYSKAEYEQKMTNIKKNYQVDKRSLNDQHIQTIKSILLKSSFTEKDLKNIEEITKACINFNLPEALSWSYYGSAKIYKELNQPVVAIQYLKLAQKNRKNPTNKILLLYAELFAITGEHERSNKNLSVYQSHQKSANSFNEELLYIDNHIALKNYQKATDKLIDLLKGSPSNQKLTTIYNKLAICYISTEQVEKGIKYYQKAIQLTENQNENLKIENQAEVKKSVSKALKKKGRFKEDVSILNKSISSFSSQDTRLFNSQEFLRLAESYFELNKLDQASNSINQFIANPNYDLIDKSEIEIIRKISRSMDNLDQALIFIDFYTALEDTIVARRSALNNLKNGTQGLQNLLQLEMLRKEKELSQNAINHLVEEDSLKEEVLTYSRWAIALLLVLIVIGVLGSKYILKVSKQRRVANQQLALRSLRSQMNPHFIFNALNSVNSFISENDQRSANKFLSNFSRLMRLVMENSEHNFIPLQKELEILKIYLQLEHFRFKDQFDYNVKIDEEVDEEEFEIPPMLIQPYIENAIWHGLRYKPSSGLLNLRLSAKKNNLIVTISDNGIGRKKSAELKTDNQKKNKSTALKNIHQRIEIFNDLHQLKIEVIIKDLNEDGTGTYVELTIPQMRKNYEN